MKNIIFGSTLRMAIISLVLCGVLFPIVVTGFAQVLLPYRANGSLVQFKGRNVGSYLIGQNFDSPIFFHTRNNSASGVDPDITLQDAYLQTQRIHSATGIPMEALKHLIDENVERTMWIVGDPYVNVLKLNLLLIQQYPSVYSSFS